MRYGLSATRNGDRIESFLSDNRLAFTVTLIGGLSLTTDGVRDSFTLDKDWIPYNGRCLGSSNRIFTAHRGGRVRALHNQLAEHFRYNGHNLAAYKLHVSSQQVTLNSPVVLTDKDLKVVFNCVVRLFSTTPRLTAA